MQGGRARSHGTSVPGEETSAGVGRRGKPRRGEVVARFFRPVSRHLLQKRCGRGEEMAAITAIEKGSGNEAEVEVVEIGFFCPNDYAGPPVGIRRGGACSFIRRIKRLPTAIWERGLDALDEILGCARRNRSINVASGRDFHPARPVRPFGGLLTSRVEMLLSWPPLPPSFACTL